MTQPRSFITWQPVLTDHQAYTYEELSQQAKSPLLAYVLTLEDNTRRSQGWLDTQVGSIDRRLIPQKKWMQYCYRHMREHQRDVHIFGSAFQSIKMIYCLLLAIWFKVEFYLVSEPYSPISLGYFSEDKFAIANIKARARPYIYRLYALVLNRWVSGVFAISKKAIIQYTKAGISSDKVFPFGYFIPSLKSDSPGPSEVYSKNEKLRIVFVGALIARKGLDLLIDAVSSLGDRVVLDVYGSGEPRLYNIDGVTVRYCGVIPFGSAQEVIARYDVLVLPSRHDGWGVVVNEAICAGVPVICSDQVGASVILERFTAGMIFNIQEPHSLKKTLEVFLQDSQLSQELTSATNVAAIAIQPDVAAGYMLSIMQVKGLKRKEVSSPWYLE